MQLASCPLKYHILRQGGADSTVSQLSLKCSQLILADYTGKLGVPNRQSQISLFGDDNCSERYAHTCCLGRCLQGFNSQTVFSVLEMYFITARTWSFLWNTAWYAPESGVTLAMKMPSSQGFSWTLKLMRKFPCLWAEMVRINMFVNSIYLDNRRRELFLIPSLIPRNLKYWA